MANDLNQCNFIGRLGRDPETVNSGSGHAISKFSIAVSEQYTDKNGEKVKLTEWVNCVAFGKLADICNKFLTKSTRVFVTGRLKTTKYIAKDGSEKSSTQLNVNEVQVLTFAEKETQDQGFDNEDIPF